MNTTIGMLLKISIYGLIIYQTNVLCKKRMNAVAVDEQQNNADTSKCSRDDVYNLLLDNSYKYGFIQRYPSGKTSITGVANEPWHYRYVGKKAAEEIHQSGMCLEEYVENLKQHKMIERSVT